MASSEGVETQSHQSSSYAIVQWTQDWYFYVFPPWSVGFRRGRHHSSTISRRRATCCCLLVFFALSAFDHYGFHINTVVLLRGLPWTFLAFFWRPRSSSLRVSRFLFPCFSVRSPLSSMINKNNNAAFRSPASPASRRRRRHATLAAVAIAAALYAKQYIFKSAKYTADGDGFVTRLFEGSSAAFKEALGLRPATFRKLLSELQAHAGYGPTRNIAPREHLAIFLYTARWAATSRLTAVTFGHSTGTITSSFKRTIQAFLRPEMYQKFIRMPTSDSPVPDRIRRDPSVRAFSAVVGAVDGTHLPARPPAALRQRFRNRKGTLSFNVLAACSFDMLFQYVYTGWEGSAADSMIYHRARQLSWRVPEGRVWLGDAGFPSCDSLLVPFRGTRYHLKEWGAGTELPRNAHELYNKKHASLRSVVERIFGVVQERFKILVSGCDYDLATQAKVFPALAVVHNFVVINDPSDTLHPDDLAAWLLERDKDSTIGAEGDLSVTSSTTRAEKKRGEERREKAANSLWKEYRVRRAALGI
ncbi:hypothetical protein CF328_g6358 [Tilletia controversa]|nr:hypothetical protein CF328_g6358 [Tilletia controversa]